MRRKAEERTFEHCLSYRDRKRIARTVRPLRDGVDLANILGEVEFQMKWFWIEADHWKKRQPQRESAQMIAQVAECATSLLTAIDSLHSEVWRDVERSLRWEVEMLDGIKKLSMKRVGEKVGILGKYIELLCSACYALARSAAENSGVKTSFNSGRPQELHSAAVALPKSADRSSTMRSFIRYVIDSDTAWRQIARQLVHVAHCATELLLAIDLLNEEARKPLEELYQRVRTDGQDAKRDKHIEKLRSAATNFQPRGRPPEIPLYMYARSLATIYAEATGSWPRRSYNHSRKYQGKAEQLPFFEACMTTAGVAKYPTRIIRRCLEET